MILDPEGLLTGYAGRRPPGPMIYWLGSKGGTPWDKLGGALPVNTMTQPLSLPYIVLSHEETAIAKKLFGLIITVPQK